MPALRSSQTAFRSTRRRSSLRRWLNPAFALLASTALLRCSDPASPNSDFRVVSGADQAAEAGASLAPIVVRMNDPLTGARAGVELRASVTAGGQVTPTDTTTNAAGDATFVWTLANTTGAQELVVEDVSTGARFTVSATATPAAVATVIVSPDPVDVTRTQTRQFAATLRDARGATLTGRSVTWSSSNTARASVIANTGLATATAVGPVDIIASSEGKSGSARMNVVSTVPTQLAITTQPGGAAHNTDFTIQPVIEIRDAGGEVVDGSGASVTASIQSGNGTLTGTTTVAAVNGVARFTNLRISGAGAFTLTFASTGLSSASSSNVGVPLGAASLRMLVQPAGAVSGTAFTVQPTVEVLDQTQARLTSATSQVTASIGSGSGTISGTTTATAVNGVATFTDLRITGTGAHTLVFVAAGLTGATSSSITVGAGPTQLGISIPPAGASSGAAFTTQPVVQIRDATGAVVTGSSAQVTAAIASGSGVLTGTVTVAATNGVATFTNLGIAGGGAHTLIFTSPGLTSATSASLTVAQVATQLVFATQPTNTTVVTTMAPVVVEARDAADAVVTSFTGNVTLSLNPTGPTLGGTLTIAAVGGVATFSNLSVGTTGTGFTLAASSASLAGTTSVPFDILVSGNYWINAAGGLWSTASNWSRGYAPLPTDTVKITLAGTYTVTLDVDASFKYLTLGGASGAQTLLSPSSRALSIANAMTIASTGTLAVSGGDLSVNNSGTSSLTNNGTITIGAGRTLEIDDGTFLHQTGATLSGPGTLSLISGTATFNTGITPGAIRVWGATATFTTPVSTASTSWTTIGFATINAPSFTNPAGKTLSINNGGTINSPLTNQGTLSVEGEAFFTGAITTTVGSTFYHKGWGNGHVNFANGFTNLGTIQLDDVSSNDGAFITIQAGQLVNAAGATITALAGAGGTKWFNGTLVNQGTINLVTGVAGSMLIQTFNNSGVINLEIGGLTPGTGHDKIEVIGTATLGGTLNVSLINGFTPTAGQTFTLLTAGTRSGTFATVNLPPSMTVQYVGATVRVNR